MDFELYAQYLWKRQTNWKTRPLEGRAQGSSIHGIFQAGVLEWVGIVECSLLHQQAQAESPLSQGPRPVFVKTLYTLSVLAQTHLPKFPETSLNKGKEKCSQS